MNFNNLIMKIKSSSFFSTIKHSRNYFFSNLVVNAIGFISLPVMTRILSTSDFGTVNVYKGYILIFLTAVTLNSYVALSRYYYEDNDDFREFFGTIIIFVLSLIFIFSLCFVIFNKYLSGLLGLPAEIICLIGPIVLFGTYNSWFDQLFAARRKSKKIAIRNIIQSYSKFGLAVLLIILLKSNKYLGQVYSEILIGFVFFIYYIFALKPYIRFSFKLKHVKYILTYALPLLPYSLSSLLLSQFDRIMINKYYSASEAGLYTFAYSIGMLLTIVLGALDKAWMPDFYKYMKEENYKKINDDIYKLYRIILVAGLALILFGKEAGMLLGKKNFFISLPLVPVIVIGYIFYSLFAFYAWNMNYLKKNIYMSIIVVASAAANIFLNLVFIPRYGYPAGAFTTAVSYFFMAILGWVTCRFILKFDYIPLKIFINPLLVIAVFITAYFIINNVMPDFIAAFIIKIVMLAVFCVIIFYKFINGILSNIINRHL